MKQVYRIICTAVLALFFIGATAQEMHSQLIRLDTSSNTLNYKIPGKRYYLIPSYIGSQFTTDEWIVADLILENGDRYDSILIKLNSFLDEIIMYNERAGAAIEIDKTVISEFFVKYEDGHSEHFKKTFVDLYPKGDRYLSIMYEGKSKLFLWHRTVEEKVSVYRDDRGIMHDSMYKLTKEYYLVFPDQKIAKFPPKRRSFIELFPEQKKQVKRIIRKNHISFETENEIIQAVKLVEKELME